MAVQGKNRKTGSDGPVLEGNPVVIGMKHDLTRGRAGMGVEKGRGEAP